jgi:hypothetical protein
VCSLVEAAAARVLSKFVLQAGAPIKIILYGGSTTLLHSPRINIHGFSLIKKSLNKGVDGGIGGLKWWGVND